MELARPAEPPASIAVPTPAPAPAAVPPPAQFRSYPRDEYVEPPTSPKFLILAIIAVVATILAAVIQSAINRHNQPATPAAHAAARVHPVAPAHAATSASPAHSVTPAGLITPVRLIAAIPVPTPKPGVFTVTTISLAEPRFAIVNGVSRFEGDFLEAHGVTNWKLTRIADGAILIQNGPTSTWLPLSAPRIRPLNDKLNPLK